MPEQTFELNGETVTVDVEDDERMLEVIRDLVGLTGPTSGRGINACMACPSYDSGNAFSPCSAQVKDIEPEDEAIKAGAEDL